MNFNPMDLIHIKEHFMGCINEKEVSRFINILIDLQRDGILDEDLKEKLGLYFFQKQELQVNPEKVSFNEIIRVFDFLSSENLNLESLLSDFSEDERSRLYSHSLLKEFDLLP